MQKRQKLICMILILLLSSLVFTTCNMTYEQESNPHYFKPIVIEAKSIPSSSVDSIDDPPLKSDVLTRENPSTQTRELPTLTATHHIKKALSPTGSMLFFIHQSSARLTIPHKAS